MVLGVKHGPHFSCLPFLTLVSCFFSQIAEHIRIFFLPLHPKIWLRMDRRSTPQECSRPQLMLATPSLASPMAYQLMVRLTQMIASSCWRESVNNVRVLEIVLTQSLENAQLIFFFFMKFRKSTLLMFPEFLLYTKTNRDAELLFSACILSCSAVEENLLMKLFR